MFEVGNTVFVRCTPMDYVGRIKEIDGLHITLEDASWVSESGRFSEFISAGKSSNMEIEPCGTIKTKYQTLIDWPHKLFTKAI